MSHRSRRLSYLPVLVAALSCSSAPAQTVTGAITGTVTDPTGAVIPNATVTAKDVDTGVSTSATTNSSGTYSLRYLPIGRYEVTAEASGFSASRLPSFALEVNQTVKFDAKLNAGAADTTVDVRGDVAPILNTTDSTLATTFTANTIANIPLNGLDFSALTLYTPGAVSTNGTSGTTGIERSISNADTPSVNGNRSQANNYTLDGIDLNESQNNLIAYSPAPESLGEIKVISANAPADYGNVNGGGIVSVLKSGTNHFHGSAYAYIQNQNFNANSWQNNNKGIFTINPYTQDQFGGTFGGPIKRDKLFFFVDYLGSRQHTGGTGTESVLTQAMRNGDFSALLSSQGGKNTPIQLYNTQTLTPDGQNFVPYANNQIAVSNPVAQFLFAHPALYPLPNAAPTDGIANSNFHGFTRSFVANNQGDAKLEYDPRQADKITGFYSMSTAYDGKTALLAIDFPTNNMYPSLIGGVNWVHIFSPAVINSARVGFTRVTWKRAIPTDPSGLFGYTGNSLVGVPFGKQGYVGYSYQGVSGSGGLDLGGTPADDQSIIDNTFSYIDDLTWQRGNHLFGFGVQAVRYQNDYFTGNNQGFLGALNYTGAFTSNPNVTGATGYGGADFLLNRVAEATVTSAGVFVGNRQWRTAGYVKDDWKTTPKLTLNLGIRYEFDEPWVEANNKTGNVVISTGQVIYAHSVPAGAPAGSGVCNNRACYQPSFNQIMPRLGLAYQVTDRFVVRAGYGATSFLEGNAANQRLTSITPFVQAVDIKAITPTTPSSTSTVAGTGTPRTVQQGFTSSNPGDVNFNGSSYNIYPQDLKPAYVQEWSLTTEYALTQTLSLQLGYLGEQGQHIEDYGNLNQWVRPGDQTSAPYFNNTTLGIGSSPILITESRGMMNYNALQATARQRVNHGLEYTVNYTFGRAMTNAVGNYGVNTSGYGSTGFQNYYDSSADYGPAGYDVRHNLSITSVYSLPFGRGQAYLSNVNHLLDEVVGGWKLSTAVIMYSGFPQTPTGPGNNSQSYGNSRPNQYRKLKIVHQNINQWFGDDPSATPCLVAGVDNGVCAFGVPASNTFGTARNGSLRGPGFRNVDFSAFKDFHTFREQAIGFRFDAFNALNVVSYGNPDTNITDATFGQIASQNSIRSTERHLQFSARYQF